MVNYSPILIFVLLNFIDFTFPKNDNTTLENYRKSHRKGKCKNISTIIKYQQTFFMYCFSRLTLSFLLLTVWGFGIGFVRFENSLCTGSDGLDGTCYTRWQCKSIGGIFSGKCANVGTCCVGNVFSLIYRLF